MFKKGDIEDLRAKLQYLSDNPDIVQSYKETASGFICNKYNWEDIVDKTLELYKEALEGATNKKVSEVYIYSLTLNKEIRIF